MNLETRSLRAELRTSPDARPKIVGYAAVFDSLSSDLGGFVERIAPGAFSRTLRENPDIRALVGHDANLVLGRTKAGTLALREDDRGLYVEIDPPNTSAGRDLIESLRRGDISQMSFAFKAQKESWSEDRGQIVRTLLDVDLYEVSVVTFPAYPNTSVGVRAEHPHPDYHARNETLRCKIISASL